jgi:HAD superfamily hydrolase (TIGR01490 family)
LAIAFFDLDRTLLSVNSGVLWVRREVALGHLSRTQALQAAAWLARYQLGFAALESVVAQAIAQLQGTPARALRERTVSFWDTQVRHAFRPGGLARLAHHRAARDRLVLLTSSSSYLAELVARELSLDAVLCNTFEIDAQGLHTGRAAGGICFGPGKLVFARAEAERQGVPLSACAFYTDSYSDISVLEQVGSPVAVNPDVRLKRLARRRGWPIENWGTP